MRLFFLAAVLAVVCGAGPAVAQRSSPRLPVPSNAQDRIALSSRAENTTGAAPVRLACAPIVGQVFNPNGQPLVGATLLVKGTHDAYVTDSEGRFQLTSPVYEGQMLTVEAAGYQLQDVSLTDCTLPRLVLTRAPDARIKRTGKRAGQVVRLHDRNTNLK